MAQQRHTQSQGKDPEMETLKKRITELEQALSAKSADYDTLSEGAKLIDEKLKKSEEVNKNLSEEAERLKQQLSVEMTTAEYSKDDTEEHSAFSTPIIGETGRSIYHACPPEIRAQLIIAAIGSIKDRQNDAPLDKKNFEHMVDPFIEQAEYIADKVIERVLCKPAVDPMSMSNEELAT